MNYSDNKVEDQQQPTNNFWRGIQSNGFEQERQTTPLGSRRKIMNSILFDIMYFFLIFTSSYSL